MRQIWGNLRQVAVFPRKLVLLTTGSFARQLLLAMTLSVALGAFGDHLWPLVMIVIITLAGIIGGVSPSPVGMGVVEAGMILGLTTAGVSGSDATTAEFIQRLFTSNPAAHLGLGRSDLDAEERVPLRSGEHSAR